MYNQQELEKDINANCGRPYQQCTISVMDTIADPNITFDEKGICNYYYEYLAAEKQNVFNGEEGQEKLSKIIQEIKNSGKGKKYDCITGVSGGVDSSYLVYKAKEWGLNPLVVHFDNGWNSEIAVSNINKLIENTGFDLYTIVVDWNEFKNLQLAYIKASVVDIEVPTDHAISGTLYKLARKYKLQYILSGNNVRTENTLPHNWHFQKGDYANLLDINDKYGKSKLKTYPIYGFWQQNMNNYRFNISTIKPLNYVDFSKDKAKEEIMKNIGWQDYGGKHFESIFTKFYQAYLLPNKFMIDKRKAHLSDLIFSKQSTKQEALEELAMPILTGKEQSDLLMYFLKKMTLSEAEFKVIMEQPRIEHNKFNTMVPLASKFPLLRILRPFKKIIKR